MPLLLKPHRVASPAEILEADPRCQKFVQSSTTLAYCCLLIRRGDLDLARHVWKVLAENQEAAFRDELVYLQAWMDMKAQDFAAAKAALLGRLEALPGDMAALSLLQACLVLELDEKARGSAKSYASTKPAPVFTSPSAQGAISTPPGATEAPPSENNPYQTVLSDPQTRGLALWSAGGEVENLGSGEGEALAAALPELFPAWLAEAVGNLEGGEAVKICFAFEHCTVTTWHGGGRNAGLVTGPLRQSLLTLARAEKIFRASPQPPVPEVA